jgi:hypothetical protein
MRQLARLFALVVLLHGAVSARRADAAEGTRLSLKPASAPLLAGNERAVFIERDAGLATDAIWSVKLDGTGRARISPDTPLATLGGFQVTADGARVVFRSDADSDGRYRLFSAPADGSGAAIAIDGTPIDPVLADVRSFRLTADSTRAVFLANLDDAAKFELYSVPVAGGTPTRLLLSLPEVIQDFRLSASAEWMVIKFRNPVNTGNYDLYQAETDQPSVPAKINASLDGTTEKIWAWQLTPPGGHVVWISNEDGGTIDIFSHTLGGGDRQRLNGLLEAENVLADTGPNMPIAISPNGNHVLFAMRSTTWPTHLTELYLAPIGGWPSNNGSPSFLGYDLPTGGRIEFSPNSAWIVYRSGDALHTRSTSGEHGPCAISQSAQSPQQGLGYLVSVLDFAIHPDSQLTAYTAIVEDSVLQQPRGRGLFLTSSGSLGMIAACGLGLNESRPVWYDLSGPAPQSTLADLPVMPAGRDEVFFTRRDAAQDVPKIFHNDWGGADFWRVSLSGGTGVVLGSLKLTPDGGTLVYLADYEGDSAPLSDVWSTRLPLFESGLECGTARWSFPAVDPCRIPGP